MDKPKLIIEIRGGVLQTVHANQEIQFIVVDWDNIKDGDDFPDEFDVEEQDELFEEYSDVLNKLSKE